MNYNILLYRNNYLKFFFKLIDFNYPLKINLIILFQYLFDALHPLHI